MISASIVLLAAAGACGFEQFPANAYTGPLAAPDIRSAEARRFRTRIRTDGAGAPNFAGHLRLISLGCGTNCQSIALVDKRDGKVWMNVEGASDAVEFRPDSRLLVLDSSPASIYPARFFAWDTQRNVLEELPGCAGKVHHGAPADVMHP